MSTNRKSPETARDPHVDQGGATGASAASKATTRYECGDQHCHETGTVEQMFNLPCDPTAVSDEGLAKRIRCNACAKKVAEKNGKRLGQPGCGTYPLRYTLGRMANCAGLRAQREATRKWVEEKLQRQDSATADASQRRRHEEMRRRVNDAVHAYAAFYGSLTANVDVPDDQLPQPLQDGDGHLVCGLPIECCNHDRPASKFITCGGQVVGICNFAAGVFLETYRAAQADDRNLRQLLSTSDLAQAEHFASLDGGKRRGKAK